MDAYLVDGHAQHFRRGLRDDGVAPRSDVGHVGLDADNAFRVEPHACSRGKEQVVSERRGDAHADQPVAVAPRAGSAASVPSETFRAELETADKVAVRERPLRLFRIDLGVVDDPEFDRIDAKLLRHLVHGDFKRHQAGRLTRSAHGVALRKIERRQAHCGHAVCSGIEQPGLHDGSLGLSAGQVARPALMRDRGDLAVAFGTDAEALNCRRSVRRVVHQERAGQRHFDRPAGGPSGKCRQYGIGAQEQLAAEAAADERRHQVNLLLIDAEGRGEVGPPPVDHLA